MSEHDCNCLDPACLDCFPHMPGSREWAMHQWCGTLVYIIGCIGGGCHDSATDELTRACWWKPYSYTEHDANEHLQLSKTKRGYPETALYRLPQIHAQLRHRYCPIQDTMVPDFQYETPRHGDRVIVFEHMKSNGSCCWMPYDRITGLPSPDNL